MTLTTTEALSMTTDQMEVIMREAFKAEMARSKDVLLAAAAARQALWDAAVNSKGTS